MHTSVIESLLISNHVLMLEYAQVLKMLGNGRLEAYCFDGSNRLCHIRGKLRKKASKMTNERPMKLYTLWSVYVLGLD